MGGAAAHLAERGTAAASVIVICKTFPHEEEEWSQYNSYLALPQNAAWRNL